ncbi:U2 small nuclear ribonucleoprotein B'' isoform X1 [Malus sylvestris]|uniref:U2 small nuclear ribonucleoprotein B'' isoform X1 n=1 Tax=Malus sylvestris TaxID=3752 RepID=UPI0021AD0BC4|nr:U2 small nuclear ribonucleoprotein B'' isoform X1 [Malus sylvestris]
MSLSPENPKNLGSDLREPPPPPSPPSRRTDSLTLQSQTSNSPANQMAHPPYDPYYLQPQPQPQPQDYSDRSAINTLFVSGLPDDVKAREIHNLFRRRPGFDSCQLKYTGRGNQVVAFATFFNHQSAMAALHSLNGVKFDPQTGSLLHIELARSNSRRKRKPGSGAYVVIDKRTKTEADTQETSSDDGESESDEPSETDKHDSGDKSDLATTKRLKELENGETAVDSENAVAAVNDQPEKHVDAGQCSTLFIANLGPNCTEDELKQVLSQYPGFNVIKLRAKGGMPVAFADFEEIEQANKAMDELRGSSLPSSDRGGMHIEYARSKMRKS